MREHDLLNSEITQLRELLGTMSPEQKISRFAFERRLQNAETRLEELGPAKHINTSKLTFRGIPVNGTEGIAAHFAGEAVTSFSDAYAAVIAGLRDKLRFMGPIPDRAQNDLMITDLAVGSFGFELELPNPDKELFEADSVGTEAMLRIENLIRTSAVGTDDDMSDVVETIHPRAISKVREFLEINRKYGALCGIEFEDRVFSYPDITQLELSLDRLTEDNIKETREEFLGSFIGVLPHRRNFEFETTSGDLIVGKVDASIEDIESINIDILNQPISVTFTVIQVGMGRPRYRLDSMIDIRNLSAEGKLPDLR